MKNKRAKSAQIQPTRQSCEQHSDVLFFVRILIVEVVLNVLVC
jgi:hypothetical protein